MDGYVLVDATLSGGYYSSPIKVFPPGSTLHFYKSGRTPIWKDIELINCYVSFAYSTYTYGIVATLENTGISYKKREKVGSNAFGNWSTLSQTSNILNFTNEGKVVYYYDPMYTNPISGDYVLVVDSASTTRYSDGYTTGSRNGNQNDAWNIVYNVKKTIIPVQWKRGSKTYTANFGIIVSKGE